MPSNFFGFPARAPRGTGRAFRQPHRRFHLRVRLIKCLYRLIPERLGLLEHGRYNAAHGQRVLGDVLSDLNKRRLLDLEHFDKDRILKFP